MKSEYLQCSTEDTMYSIEGGQLISHILQIIKSLNLKSYIVTVDIEEVFGSLSHSSLSHFYPLILKNMVIKNDFTKWVKTSLECEESCILMEVIQENISNFERVLNKAIYLCIYLCIYSF